MKKIISLMLAVFAISTMAFSATISIERKKPSTMDLSFAKTMEIKPVQISSRSEGDAERKTVEIFISELMNYAKEDGKFVVKYDAFKYVPDSADVEKSDIYLDIYIRDYRITDSGATITNKVDGEEVVISDSWKRMVGGDLQISIIRGNDNTVLGKKEFQIFAGNSEPVAKSQLGDPVELVRGDCKNWAFITAQALFDTYYNVPLTIMDTKSKDKVFKKSMKDAYKVLKGKNYMEAKDTYAKLYSSSDDFAAGYNYAVCLAICNEYDQALELFTKLYGINSDKKIRKTIETVTQLQTEYNTMTERLQK